MTTVIPRADVPPDERERILRDLLRRATDTGCRKDIVAVLAKKKPSAREGGVRIARLGTRGNQ